MPNRRDFLKKLGAAAIAANVPGLVRSHDQIIQPNPGSSKDDLVWAMLIHLGYNMWMDFTPLEFDTPFYPANGTDEEVANWAEYYHPMLTCDTDTWDRMIRKFSQSGINMVIIDIGDGVVFESHPEIAVKNAWSVKQLKNALRKIRELGMEPVPKLNFSAAHKAWLGDYQYMISSKHYYSICSDLIDEVVDIFEKPRYFHIGMDEEDWDHQSAYHYAVIRNNDQWWKDFYFLVDQVERNGVRSWIWSDNIWRNRDEFINKMPKSVLQSNWVYEEQGPAFNKKGQPIDSFAQAFIDLEKNGFDQIPTASIWLNGHWNNDHNFENIVENTKRIISPKRLKGFMQTVWMPVLPPCLNVYNRAAKQVKLIRETY